MTIIYSLIQMSSAPLLDLWTCIFLSGMRKVFQFVGVFRERTDMDIPKSEYFPSRHVEVVPEFPSQNEGTVLVAGFGDLPSFWTLAGELLNFNDLLSLQKPLSTGLSRRFTGPVDGNHACQNAWPDEACAHRGAGAAWSEADFLWSLQYCSRFYVRTDQDRGEA